MFQRHNTQKENTKMKCRCGKNEAVCDTGDVLVSDTHIVLVIKPVDEMKSYLIAESTGVGVKLSYYSYNNLTYSCKRIKYSN